MNKLPAISMFYGIIVYMYFDDNDKHHKPHIHVKYSGQEAVFSIKDKEILEGNVPIKARNLIKAWIEIHREELIANWELAVNSEEIFKIEPLK